MLNDEILGLGGFRFREIREIMEFLWVRNIVKMRGRN